MYTKIPVGNMGREEWLRLRRTGIGGSDAGAVCGLNPYSSPVKVYHDKTCDIPEEQDSEAVRQGHVMRCCSSISIMHGRGAPWNWQVLMKSWAGGRKSCRR